MNIDVLIDYSKYSDGELVVEAQHIVDEMTENPNFPTPVPTIVELVAAINDFVSGLAACGDGGTKFTLSKNRKRAILLEKLRSLGLFVQVNCANDLNKARSSGFKTRKAKEPFGILSKPQNLKVVPGPFPGSIKVSVDSVKGAILYIYEWALAPVNGQTAWEYDLGKTSMVIKNLVQGKEYAFRVAAKGSAEGKVFTDIVTHFVA